MPLIYTSGLSEVIYITVLDKVEATNKYKWNECLKKNKTAIENKKDKLKVACRLEIKR
jgi:hypothetical protein